MQQQTRSSVIEQPRSDREQRLRCWDIPSRVSVSKLVVARTTIQARANWQRYLSLGTDSPNK